MIMKRRRERKGRETPSRRIKISNFFHSSRVTKFRTMAQRAWRHRYYRQRNLRIAPLLSNVTAVGKFEIFRMGTSRSFPFPPPLHYHFALLT
jgi:hypothetical protein